MNDSLIDISKYKIIKRLSSGGFGTVYSCKNKETNQLYAAKIINSIEIQKTIEREIHIMMKAKHHTIIKFYGYSKIDFHGENNITIIMELATEGSLKDLIQKVQHDPEYNNCDNTTRQKILIGISCGMMYLHQNKIIHRDLKPENILLDDNLEPHITDFGLSKVCLTSQSTNLTPCIGTPLYMAPEVIKSSLYSFKADVYSFGILMYEVVTGQNPFPQSQMPLFQFYSKIVNDDYRPIFNVPVKPSIRELMEQCWSPDSRKRPTFSEIFEKLTKSDFWLDKVEANNVENYVEKISGKILRSSKVTKNTDNSKVTKNTDNSKVTKNTDNSKVTKNTDNSKVTKNTDKWISSCISYRYDRCYIDLKIVILGMPSAEKTSIINRLCNNHYIEDRPTIGAGFFSHMMNIDNKEVNLMLWETAGQERFRSVAPSLLRGSHGLVLVYDVTDEKTFDELENYLSLFLDAVDVSECPCFPVLLLGNKIELGECSFADKVEKWKEMHNIVHSAFVSAKTGTGINEAFYNFIKELIAPINIKDGSPEVIIDEEESHKSCF